MSSPENNKVPKKDKPLREVSVEGCELIGKGGNGAVYRLDPETIVSHEERVCSRDPHDHCV